ncbi:ABC transporter substrate-binding protein [Puniceibacterium sediminis]|uniref:Peptide/nickel transport system substrate-binding protein n=1 Tax=Puniceibacterium sediminis TaxID=1608407 RepID=A0A238VS60_9RHOB|nr:ABC transporter substrate-binding protein [Puniceibacterium sediminis]SNR37170.1 peptide/nickel transport system substrate-binding protein [Puniceibacterium sediminis]
MTISKTLGLALVLGISATALFAADLRIGLQEDPDVLDPDQSRTFVGRIVYASLCDKLVDITPELVIVPQLASGWSWSDDGLELTMTLRDGVTFHDGTPFNAEAVIANVDRSQNMDESRRKSELSSITGAEAVDDLTVKFTLGAPDATLLAQLADRAGMMVSPTAASEAGVDFGLNPVCSGPFKFVERVQQDRIVLEKFAEYWNADSINFDKVLFLPIPDTTVRLANLRSGDLDMLERLAATDVTSVKEDGSLQMEQAVSLGYQGITVNVANTDRAANPLGENSAVRRALSLAIDRSVINQVVFEGAFAAGNQPFPPTSPWYNKDFPVPGRDIEAAKALLEEAGFPDGVTVEVQVPNNPVQMQLMQVVQAMAAEAGINIELLAKEFATLLSDQSAGAYTASQVGWSGRVDPDGNIHQFMTTDGGINDSHYSNAEVDGLLNSARVSNDMATRKKDYDAALAILQEDMPIIYLYHQAWIWALDEKVQGFVPYPDGMIRLEGVSLSE